MNYPTHSRVLLLGGSVVLVVVALRTLGSILRHTVLVPQLTILADIPNLGKRSKAQRIPGQVVICGGRYGFQYALGLI